MLLHSTLLYVSMFIVLALCQDFLDLIYKPFRINPIDDEIELEEGETFSFSCKSETLLKFIYPDFLENSIKNSEYNIKYQMEKGLYHYEFQKINIVSGETGWYGCADYNYDSSSNPSDNKIDRLYVYVKSNTNLFVKADNVHLSAVSGGSVVIPCRTTSKNLTPILIKDNGVLECEVHETSYNPKIGFFIRNLSLKDSSCYKCSIEKDGGVHVASYVLSILKQNLPEPKIRANNLFITHGEDLHINCTVEVKLSMDFEFDWNMPENNSRRNIRQFRKQLNGNIVLVTSQLTIFNVTEKNSGNYECIIRSIDDEKKTTKNVILREIIFFNNNKTSVFLKKRGESVQMIAVARFVEPILQWFRPNGDEIKENSKNITIFERYESYVSHSIINVKMYSILKISSLNVTDSGIYILQARKDYMIEKINFTLNVSGEPIPKLTHVRSYYKLNESTEFRCEVVSNPRPHITWTFLKYPKYPFFGNPTVVDLTNATQSTINNSNYIFESTVKMFIEMSGKIRCQACNTFNCNSKTENIIISVPPFFVETNMDESEIETIDVVTEGYNTVILKCFADGMPRPRVTWYKDTVLLKENNKYLFYHIGQELHIRHLMLNDSGKYSCRADNSIGTNETFQQITVKSTKWNMRDLMLITSIIILGFILIILAISFTIKIHREKKMKKKIMEAGLMHFEEGALESLNPNLTVDEQAELLPYDKKWEFPRERLKLKEQLGSGNFGVVMKAEAIGIRTNEDVTIVAVKMIRRNLIYINAFASELKIMVHLGKHLNVVNLLGACTKNILQCELLMIFEYCRFGSLRNYLLRHRDDFINQINLKTGRHDFTIGINIPTRTIGVNSNNSLNANSVIDVITHYGQETSLDSSKINSLADNILSDNLSQSEWRPNYCNNNNNKDHNAKPICTRDLLSWAFQVARGMEYLSQRKILHGDLAARNILLAEDNVVKICDFGLAKNIYKYGNYKKKSKVPVPIKWMAIESIKDRIFSTQSDVWSFGVMLWEFFTLAETPYPSIEVMMLHQKLIEGYRMEQPDYAIDEVYDIMLQCWIAKPTLRPSFTDIVESMGNLLEEDVKMHYITLNNKYMDINMMNLKNRKDDYLMMMSAPDHAVLSLPTDKGENSLLRETPDSSYLQAKSGCSPDESKIFSPRSVSGSFEYRAHVGL